MASATCDELKNDSGCNTLRDMNTIFHVCEAQHTAVNVISEVPSALSRCACSGSMKKFGCDDADSGAVVVRAGAVG